MTDESAPEELAARLAELERQHADGSISEIAYNLRRNLLITRSDELARRRAAATSTTRVPVVAPPARRTRRGLVAATADRRPEAPRPRPSPRPLGAGPPLAPPGEPLVPPTQSAPSQSAPAPPQQVTPEQVRPAQARPAQATPGTFQAPESAPPDRAPALADGPAARVARAPGAPRPPAAKPAGGAPGRRRGRAVALGLAAVAVVAGALMVALIMVGGHHPSGAATSARTTPDATPTPSVHAPSPSPSAGALLGETRTTSDGAAITVIEFDGDLASLPGTDPPTPPATAFAAVELRICAGNANPTSVTPYDFVLIGPGSSRADTLNGPGVGRGPELPLTEVAPGQCVSGWLSYEVGGAPTSLSDTADSLSWPLG
jgi:hypothetical protein